MRRFASIAIMVLAASWTCVVEGSDADLKARVLREYPPALKRLASTLSECRGSGLVKNENLSKGAEPDHTSRVQFERSGSLCRVTKSRADHGDNRKPGAVVHCRGKGFGVVLKRDSRRDRYVVRSYGEPQVVRFPLSIFVDRYVDAPIRLFDLPIVEMMADKSFLIREVSEIHGETGSLLKIKFSYDSPLDLIRSGWFIVDPNRGWVVRRYMCLLGAPGAGVGAATKLAKGEVDYSDSDPKTNCVPRRVKLDFLDNRIEFNFDEFLLGPVPASDFTLTAFGLPERGPPRPGS